MLPLTGRFRAWFVAASAAALIVAATLPATAAPHDGALVAQYAAALGGANSRLKEPARRDLAERVLLLTSYYRIDPRLLVAIVTVESSWRARAVSPAGALGYGQLMPGTAATLNVDALEPYENLDGTARYLRRMLNAYASRDAQTRVRLALASYNAGPAAVARYGGVPPYRETQAYVRAVMRRWHELSAYLAVPTARDRSALAAAGTTRPVVVMNLSGPAAGQNHTRRPHKQSSPKQLALARARAYHSPYLDATDPNSGPLDTAPPVRYERSHSFVARMFGLRHRVVDAPAMPAPAKVQTLDLSVRPTR
jgi:soluble lytic murein transglycosylase-like protein